jgi:hypothetical protein
LIDNLVIAIEGRLITYPSEYKELIDELSVFEYKITDAGNITYSAPEGKHDDCVISLALAVWALRNNLKESQIVQKYFHEEDMDNQGGGTIVKPEEDYEPTWL